MYIVTTDGKSSSQLRNTVESKVEVMLRYSMLKMLVVDTLIRWRLSSWFDFVYFLSLEMSYTYTRCVFVFFLERDFEVSLLALL